MTEAAAFTIDIIVTSSLCRDAVGQYDINHTVSPHIYATIIWRNQHTIPEMLLHRANKKRRIISKQSTWPDDSLGVCFPPKARLLIPVFTGADLEQLSVPFWPNCALHIQSTGVMVWNVDSKVWRVSWWLSLWRTYWRTGCWRQSGRACWRWGGCCSQYETNNATKDTKTIQVSMVENHNDAVALIQHGQVIIGECETNFRKSWR